MKSASSATSGKPRLTTSAMIASIASEGQRTKPAPFGHALVELARSRPEVVGLTADLGKYTDLHIFAKQFPERYYQMGMAEQLLFGAASGIPGLAGRERHERQMALWLPGVGRFAARNRRCRSGTARRSLVGGRFENMFNVILPKDGMDV